MMLRNQKRVQIEASTLLEVLTKNRKAHEAHYREALKDYQEALVSFFQQTLERMKGGDFSVTSHKLEAPQNYLEEYDVVIGMIQNSKDTEFTLDEDAYKAYFMDKWPWKNGFAVQASGYKQALAGLASFNQ